MLPRYGFGKPPHPLLQSIIEANRETYAYWLHKALTYREELLRFPGQVVQEDRSIPVWNNGFLPGLDITMLYTLVAATKPNHYVEIGSGNSTKVVARAKRDQGLNTQIISIDPAPRAEIDQLTDEVIRKPFEDADLEIFSRLESGDIVFVDNSHRIFQNSDAAVFFLDVLPYLPAGVIVHVHDVYLPFDYPPEITNRYYSEQYVLAAFILANPSKYYTIMPNYFVSVDAGLSAILDPLWMDPALPAAEKHGASYWIQIRG